MLIRYRRTEDGRAVAKALVYTEAEHRIDRSRIDPDAVRIIERLRENGHEAYIVGGAVRDLLLGRRPKDFDIVTDAEPSRIRRIFRNARVIGRRFRLVHVYAGPKIFEVSTFRSIANGTVGNEYGTMDEDALRRDFTLNALYYDPLEAVLIDYVSGFKHIGKRRIQPVIPLDTIFKEDPVRMIRCVKYAATSGFRIPFRTRLAMRRDAPLLAGASPSRLTEEFVKILASGASAAILAGLADFGLLAHILPAVDGRVARGAGGRRGFFAALEELDTYAADGSKEKRLSLLLAHFLKPFLEAEPSFLVDAPEAYQEAVREARLLLAPLNPPRVELEAAVLVLFKKRGLSPLQRPRRPGPERSRGGERVRHGEHSQTPVSPLGIPDAALSEDSSPPRPRKRRRKPASKKVEGGGATGDGGSQTPVPPPQEGHAAPRNDGPLSPGAAGATGAKPAPKRRRRRKKPADGSPGGAAS